VRAHPRWSVTNPGPAGKSHSGIRKGRVDESATHGVWRLQCSVDCCPYGSAAHASSSPRASRVEPHMGRTLIFGKEQGRGRDEPADPRASIARCELRPPVHGPVHDRLHEVHERQG
jgi:hypothetical protein